MAAPSAITSGGRPRSTTRARIAEVALDLFARQGFERTTVDEIASAAGIGRRTVFRYFPSKNDMVWSDFDRVLERLRAALSAHAQEPMMDALRKAVVESNEYEPGDLPALRMRMTLITRVPALQGHAMLRYGAWRRVVAEFSAARLGCRYDDLLPQTLAHAALGTSIAAFTRWVRVGDEDLGRCLDQAYRGLADGFDFEAIGHL
ncbi:MAG TPA: mycofactocin system transcriptional regulator [Solirubrobacterales bacterium]|nr:mycofactocin system transcriptional regulator [Solirubrobacterales bacterium]